MQEICQSCIDQCKVAIPVACSHIKKKVLLDAAEDLRAYASELNHRLSYCGTNMMQAIKDKIVNVNGLINKLNDLAWVEVNEDWFR
jgi:hypothetical protein